MTRIPRILSLAAAIVPMWCLAVEPLRVVATGGRIGSTFYAPAAGSTSFWQRTPHKLGGPVTEIQVGFMDWMYPSSGGETANDTNDVTIQFAWLERAATGQIVPLTFSGARQFVLPMNSTTPYWLADPIASAAWTGSAPVRDEVFWLHVKGTVPEGGKLPVGTPSTFPGAKFIVYPPANDPGTHDSGGAVPAITGSAARVVGLPLVFLGRFTGPGFLSVIGIGDSILDGSGDASNPVPVVTGYGFFNRAALDANGANTIAMFNLSRHGQAASAWVSPGKQQRQAPFLHFANVVVEEYGTNDIGQGGTGSVSTLVTNLETIWTTARNAGVRRIIRTKLMPRTISTSYDWTSFADQTPNTGWGAAALGDTGKRDALNAALVTALAAGKLDGLVDTLSLVSDPTDNHYWLSNGVADYMTSDGTHLRPAANALLAAPLRAALLSLTVDVPETSYQMWSNGIEWAGGDSSSAADPNADGISNQLAYALDLPPLGTVPPGLLPRSERDLTDPVHPWLSFFYRENPAAADLRYTVQSSANLAVWNNVVTDDVSVFSEIADANPDGDGSAILRRIRMKLDANESSRFLRLQVSR